MIPVDSVIVGSTEGHGGAVALIQRFGSAANLNNITRPALSDERVQLNAAGQVGLRLKTPWCDGTTHLEFMQRLAALIPRPRLHLISLVSA